MLEKLSRNDLISTAASFNIEASEDDTKSVLAAKIADAIRRAATSTEAIDDTSFYADDIDRQFIESDDVLADLACIAAFDLMHINIYDRLQTVRTSETCSRCAQSSLSTMTTASSVIVSKVFIVEKDDDDNDVVTDKIDQVASTYRFDDLKRRSICTQCLLRKATLRQYLERYLVQHCNVRDFRKHAHDSYAILALRSDSLADALQRVNVESDDMLDKFAAKQRNASDISKEIVSIDESKRDAALEAIANLRAQQTERAAKFESRRARVAAQLAAR